MKIERKHLAPYLPYRLEVMHKGFKSIVFSLSETEVLINVGKNDPRYRNLNDVMPILRPLSDLVKEIKVCTPRYSNGEKFTPFVKLLDYHIEGGKNYDDILYAVRSPRSYINTLPYHAMAMLFKWHFDIFGLINKGLAIDINTL